MDRLGPLFRGRQGTRVVRPHIQHPEAVDGRGNRDHARAHERVRGRGRRVFAPKQQLAVETW